MGAERGVVEPAFEMFFLTILIIDIFVGFRPSKIQDGFMFIKTRNFDFGDPTTGRGGPQAVQL